MVLYLEATPAVKLSVFSARSEGIVHIGAEAHTHDENVMKSLAFDWYLLSLANVVLGWRLRGTVMQSTFLHSAQRMGTIRCRDRSNPMEGKPSMGYVLLMHKRHFLHWNGMFQYGVWNITDLR